MNKQIDIVGKVCVTADGIWNKNNKYDELCVVTDETTGASYLSRQPVPANIDISNMEYWQPISSHTARNGSFIVLADKNPSTGELVLHTLESAIASIDIKDRNPGLILGFYGIDYSVSDEFKTWFLYQFDSDNTDDWNNLDKWTSLYNNVNKFRGFYSNESELNSIATRPTIGDYAFVGENMEHAILYMCIENGKWSNTQTPAYEFMNLYEGIGSKDFDDFDYLINERYADRAEKDSLGRIIHFTYITREGLSNYIIDKLNKYIAQIDLPEKSIQLKHLSDSLVALITSGGNVTNMPDEEDLTIKNVNSVNVLKLKDKAYAPANFSGLGRKYLRKNMVDGVNVLEKYMIEEPNTIYVIQYDYCLNDAEIIIPENCVLQFEGGTINGGTLFMNNTKVVGVFTKEEIGINLKINGYYRAGQSFYDTELETPIYFNGSAWIDALGNYILMKD